MPAPLKVDFYKTEDSEGQNLNIRDFVNRAFALGIEDRHVDYGGNNFILLYNIRDHGRLLLGEVLKTRMNDLPDKASRITGVPADLGLRPDEGICRHAHFLYDSENCTLLLQRDREVRHPAFREAVAAPIGAEF